MRKRVTKRRVTKVKEGPLTLVELQRFAIARSACYDGLAFLRDLIERHGSDAPAKIAWDECEDGDWISWLTEMAHDDRDERNHAVYLSGRNRWFQSGESSGAYARECYSWNAVEGDIWARLKIKRRRPGPPLPIEERLKLLERRVATLERKRR